MDLFSMGVVTGNPAPTHSATPQKSASSASETDFGSLLSSMMGSTSQSGEAVQGIDYNALAGMQNSSVQDTIRMLMAGDKPAVTDPVLSQLLEMMKQLSGTDKDAQIEQLIAQMQQRLQKILEENGGQVAGQQAQALIALLMPQLTGMNLSGATATAVGTDGGNALLQTMLNTQPKELMAMIKSLPAETAATGSNADLLTQLAGSGADPVLMSSLLKANTPAQTAIPAQPMTEADVQVEMQHAPLPQNRFELAVRTAKQQLSDQLNIGGKVEAKPAEEVKLDIDALQQRVDAGEFMRNTAFVQAPAAKGEAIQTYVAPEMQLAQQVETALKTGIDQLTVRLNPEELGEVTIQLTKTVAGMNLNIIARNPETQALLAGQIDAMRDAMKPLNVEVGEVLSQQQFDMLSQQFGRERRSDQQPMHGAAYYKDDPLTAGDSVEEQPAAALSSALDTYI